MKNVCIFTASTGGGHNLAAQSVQQALLEKGITSAIYDTFKDSNPLLNRMVVKGYEQMVEIAPVLYRVMYQQFNLMTPFQKGILNTVSFFINPDIVHIIKRDKPSLMISTHPYVTYLLAGLKEHGVFDVPIVSFVTDYKGHGLYVGRLADAYIVATEYTKKTLIEKNVPEDIIYPYGIPIRQEFREKLILKDRKTDETPILTILLMAGSLGGKQLERAFTALMRIENKLKIIVVCGKNKKIKTAIEQLIQIHGTDNKEISIYGFVDNISQLMDEADALITKPGGLTTTEAIIKNIPMIIPYVYPGQEEENADFLVANGMAIRADKISDLTEIISFLISHKFVMERMIENMSQSASNYSLENTVELCIKMMDAHEKN